MAFPVEIQPLSIGLFLVTALLYSAPGCRFAAEPAPPEVGFRSAIEAGDTERVRALVGAGAEANAPFADSSGQPAAEMVRPLHLAAQFGHAGVIRALADAGADTEARTARAYTPLMYAAFYGHPEATSALIEAGADVHAERPHRFLPERGTALLFAAGYTYDPDAAYPPGSFDSTGHTEAFRALLASGSDLHRRTASPGGPTPGVGVLEAAASAGRVGILRAALKADSSGALLREHGHDAFAAAVRGRHLPGAGADRRPAMDLLYEAGVVPDSAQAGSLLAEAVHRGEVRAARRLLEMGAPLQHRLRFSRGSTTSLLDLAVSKGDAEMVGLLLEMGAPPSEAESHELSPLVSAAGQGADGMIRALLAAGADPNERSSPIGTDSPQTPLEAAARRGNASSARLLLAAGAVPDAPGWLGNTPFESALMWTTGDWREVLGVLAEAGAQPDSVRLGELVALYNGLPDPRRIAALEALLDLGASPNHSVPERRVFSRETTPLHSLDAFRGKPMPTSTTHTQLTLAATYGNVEAVRLLLAAGADASAPGGFGLTPLETARAHGFEETADVLREHLASQR